MLPKIVRVTAHDENTILVDVEVDEGLVRRFALPRAHNRGLLERQDLTLHLRAMDKVLRHPFIVSASKRTAPIPRKQRLEWIDSIGWFIPKSIREPWLGDLREDRVKMRADGRSERYIRWATAWQVAILFFNSIKTAVIKLVGDALKSAT